MVYKFVYRYLNNQVIKKQKYSEADLAYGGVSMDQIRSSMLEVGEVTVLNFFMQILLSFISIFLVGSRYLAAVDDRTDGEKFSTASFAGHQLVVKFGQFLVCD